MGRRDRRPVEGCQRATESLLSIAYIVVGPLDEQEGDLVGGRYTSARSTQCTPDLDEPLAHSLPQLAGGHARERHEQNAVERGPLGYVARREARDRVGLARARAGLQNDDPAWEI